MPEGTENPRAGTSNVGIVVLAGLNEDPHGGIHTLRKMAERWAKAVDGKVFCISWSNVTAKDILAWQQMNDIGIIIFIGHSFGGAAGKWLIDQFAASSSCFVDLFIAFDPCPNADRFHQFFSWQQARNRDECRWEINFDAVGKVVCFYQHNQTWLSLPFLGEVGVCGVPFRVMDAPSDRLLNVDVTGYGLDHNGVPESQALHLLCDVPFKNLMQEQGIEVKGLS